MFQYMHGVCLCDKNHTSGNFTCMPRPQAAARTSASSCLVARRTPPFSSGGAIVVMFMYSWGNPPPTALIVRRWTVVMAARGPWHHRDGRRCASRSAMAIRSFPGAVLPPSRKGCCWRGNNGGRGWAALARGFGRGGDGAIGGGRSHGHRRARWRRIERHRAIMEAWRSEACRIRRKLGALFFLAKRRFGWNPHKVDQGSA